MEYNNNNNNNDNMCLMAWIFKIILEIKYVTMTIAL